MTVLVVASGQPLIDWIDRGFEPRHPDRQREQLFFTPNWSLLAKFDGEFASGYQLYAGSGTLRHTW